MIKRILKIVKQNLNLFYRQVFGKYRYELEQAVGESKSLLDVGCGRKSPILGFSKRLYCVGVDAFAPSIEQSRAAGIHDDYRQCDVLEIDEQFETNSFDCVVASDLIEHLTPEEGLSLLAKMEDIARHKVIVFTPNGFLPQEAYGNNPSQVHKSGWEVDQMRRMGFEVIGINGLKHIRGEKSKVVRRPVWFWRIVSDFSQFYARNHPEKAFQLLCVKTKKSP